MNDFKDLYFSIMEARIKTQALLSKQEEIKHRRIRSQRSKKFLSSDRYRLESTDDFKSENGSKMQLEEAVHLGQTKVDIEAVSAAFERQMRELLFVEIQLLKVKDEQLKCSWHEIEIKTELQNAKKLRRRISLLLKEEMTSSLTYENSI